MAAPVLIALPLNFNGAVLARELDVRGDVDISFFIDKNIDMDVFMTSIASDVKSFINLNVISDLDWRKFKYVIFPSLNSDPGMEDHAFGDYMKNMFEKHLSSVKFHDQVNIFFSENLRGLIACNELGQAKPELRDYLFAVTSIHYMGRQVWSILIDPCFI